MHEKTSEELRKHNIGMDRMDRLEKKWAVREALHGRRADDPVVQAAIAAVVHKEDIYDILNVMPQKGPTMVTAGAQKENTGAPPHGMHQKDPTGTTEAVHGRDTGGVQKDMHQQDSTAVLKEEYEAKTADVQKTGQDTLENSRFELEGLSRFVASVKSIPPVRPIADHVFAIEKFGGYGPVTMEIRRYILQTLRNAEFEVEKVQREIHDIKSQQNGPRGMEFEHGGYRWNCQELLSQNGMLQQEVQALRIAYKQLEATYGEQSTYCKNLKEEQQHMEKVKNRNKELADTCETLGNTIKNHENLTAINRELSEKCDKLEKELADARSLKDDPDARNRMLAKTCDNLKNEVDTLGISCYDLATKNQGLEDSCEDLKKELRDMGIARDGLLHENRELKSTCENLEKALEVERAKTANMGTNFTSSQMESLREALGSALKENEITKQIKEQVATLTDTIHRLVGDQKAAPDYARLRLKHTMLTCMIEELAVALGKKPRVPQVLIHDKTVQDPNFELSTSTDDEPLHLSIGRNQSEEEEYTEENMRWLRDMIQQLSIVHTEAEDAGIQDPQQPENPVPHRVLPSAPDTRTAPNSSSQVPKRAEKPSPAFKGVKQSRYAH